MMQKWECEKKEQTQREKETGVPQPPKLGNKGHGKLGPHHGQRAQRQRSLGLGRQQP